MIWSSCTHPIGIVIALVGKDLRLEQDAKGRRECHNKYDEEDQHFHQRFQDTKKHDGINTKCAESTTDKHDTEIWLPYWWISVSEDPCRRTHEETFEVIYMPAPALEAKKGDILSFNDSYGRQQRIKFSHAKNTATAPNWYV